MIRAATANDAAGIVPIYNQIITQTTITFASVPKTEDEISEMIARADAYLVACDADGSVLGFASFAPFRGGPGYAQVKEHSICLSETARGSGSGSRLLKALEDEARAQGVRYMVAGVSGENNSGIAFHAKNGYERVGLMPQIGHKFGRNIDLVLMQKTL